MYSSSKRHTISESKYIYSFYRIVMIETLSSKKLHNLPKIFWVETITLSTEWRQEPSSRTYNIEIGFYESIFFRKNFYRLHFWEFRKLTVIIIIEIHTNTSFKENLYSKSSLKTLFEYQDNLVFPFILIQKLIKKTIVC